MDFEQIKNQFLQKGKQALDAIRKTPKISESIGIPYAKEVNQYVNTGKLQSDLGKAGKISYESAGPSIERFGIGISQLPNQFILKSLQNEDPASKLIEESTLNRYKENIAKGKDVAWNTEQLNKYQTDLNLREQKKQENIKYYKSEIDKAVSRITELDKKTQEINKKYGVESVFSIPGAAAGLTQTVPSLIAQYAIPLVITAASRGRLAPQALTVGRLTTSAESYTQSYLEAKKEGADDKSADQYATLNGSFAYLTSKLPTEKMFEFLSKPAQKEASKSFSKNISKELLRFSKAGVAGGGAEMTEELAQQLVSNAAKVTYKDLKDIKLTEGLAESAFLGFLGGGATGVGGAAFASPNINIPQEPFQTQTFNREFKLNNETVNEINKQYKSVEEIDNRIKENAKERENLFVDTSEYNNNLREEYALKLAKRIKQGDVVTGDTLKPQTEEEINTKLDQINKKISDIRINIEKDLGKKYDLTDTQQKNIYLDEVDNEVAANLDIARLNYDKNKLQSLKTNLQNKEENTLNKINKVENPNLKNVLTNFYNDIENFKSEGYEIVKKYSKSSKGIRGVEILIYKDKQLVGTIGYIEKKNNINVRKTEVPPEFRRQGIGTILYKQMYLDTLGKQIGDKDEKVTAEGQLLRDAFNRILNTSGENNAVLETVTNPTPSEVEPTIENTPQDIVEKIEDSKIANENDIPGVEKEIKDQDINIDNEVKEIENLLNNKDTTKALKYLQDLPKDKGEKVYRYWEQVARGRTDLDPAFVEQVKLKNLKYYERTLSKEAKDRIERDNEILDEVTIEGLEKDANDLLNIASEVENEILNGTIEKNREADVLSQRIGQYVYAKTGEDYPHLYVESLYNKLKNNRRESLANDLATLVRPKLGTSAGRTLNLLKYFYNPSEVENEIRDSMFRGGLFGGTFDKKNGLDKLVRDFSGSISNVVNNLRNQFGLDEQAINEVYNKIKDLNVDEVNRIYKVTGDPEQDTLKANQDVVEDLLKSKEIDKQLDDEIDPEINTKSDILTGLGISGKDKNLFTGKSNQKKKTIDENLEEDPEQELEPHEKLAKMFNRDIDNYLNTKPAKYRDVVKQMIAQLYKVGKEKLPQKFTTPDERIKTLYENLREALNDVENYKDIWNDAKVLVYDKYGKDPAVEAILIDFFNRDVPNVFTDADAKRVYKDLIKERKIKFKDLVKTTFQNINSTKQDLQKSLLENLDLDAKTAQTLTNEVYKLFNADVKKAINTPGYLQKLRPSRPEAVINLLDKDIETLLKGKPKPVIDAYKRQVRRLANIAKSKLPFDKNLEREKYNNELFKDLGIALADSRNYQRDWEMFKQMLSDKYSNNQDVLNITKDILNARSSDLFTPQEFNRVFGIVKKDTGIVFKDLVKQTTQDIEAKRVEAENYLLNKLGINREQARSLLNRFNVEFDNGIILARSKGGAVRMEPTKGEKVADKLFAYNQNARATQEDRQVATDVMNQYLLMARQFFQNIGDINTLTPDQKLKLLRDSIKKVSTEQSKYSKLHNDAINIVKEKYKNDPIAMQQLQEYFDGIIPGSFTKTQVNKVFKDVAGDINFNDLVKSHFSKRNSTVKELEAKIMNDYGLSQKDATRITNEIYQKFNQKYNTTLNTEINRRVKTFENKLKPKERKSINERLVEYVNLGFFDSEGLADIARDVFNLPKLTKQDREFIQDQVFKTQTGEQNMNQAYINISREMIKKNPFNLVKNFNWRDFDIFRRQNFYSNLLSGIQTYLRNPFQTLVTIFGRNLDIAVQATFNEFYKRTGSDKFEQFGYSYVDIPEYNKRLFSNLKLALDNAASAWDKDYLPRSSDYGGNQEYTFDQIDKIIRGRESFVGFRAVSNLLESQDQFLRTTLETTETWLNESKGMSTDEASKKARDLSYEVLGRKEDETGSKEEIEAKIGKLNAWIERATKAIIRAKNTDNPVVNAIMDSILPIVSIGSNILKLRLEYNPLAQGYKIYTKGKAGGKITNRDRASMAIGTAIALIALSKYMNGQIQGELPEDEEEKQKAEEAGRKRNSVEFGDYWLSTPYLGNYGQMFEIMAGINDVTTSKDYLKTDALSNAFNMILQSTLKATNDTVVRNIVDLNKNILTGQGNPGENIQKMVNNAVLNNFGLYRALFRDLAEILDPYQRQYEGMEEDIKRGIPGARETLKPRYDYFGQPIKATFDTTVLPYPVGVANKNAEDEYQKLMTQNQIRLKAEAAPELKERKESKDVAKSQLRQVYTEGISKPGNVQKATQIIKSNELSQEDVSSIQNEISKQKVIDKLPAEAQPLINFTKDELKTFASISPENKKLVDEFNKLQPKLEFESKIGTNAVDYQLRNLNTVRKGKITIPKVSVKKGKKSKVKKGKVIKLKTPKFSGKPYTLPSPKKVKIPKVSVKKLKKNRTGVARVKVK